MSGPVLKQKLTFSGDGLVSGSKAYFPDSFRGQFTEWTVYIEFGASVTAGKIQIETAFADTSVTSSNADYSGTWAAVGSTIDWAAATTQKYASVTGVFDLLRLNISTTVANGPVTAYVVAASHAP
jgi:hypothetical protein